MVDGCHRARAGRVANERGEPVVGVRVDASRGDWGLSSLGGWFHVHSVSAVDDDGSGVPVELVRPGYMPRRARVAANDPTSEVVVYRGSVIRGYAALGEDAGAGSEVGSLSLERFTDGAWRAVAVLGGLRYCRALGDVRCHKPDCINDIARWQAARLGPTYASAATLRAEIEALGPYHCEASRLLPEYHEDSCVDRYRATPEPILFEAIGLSPGMYRVSGQTLVRDVGEGHLRDGRSTFVQSDVFTVGAYELVDPVVLRPVPAGDIEVRIVDAAGRLDHSVNVRATLIDPATEAPPPLDPDDPTFNLTLAAYWGRFASRQLEAWGDGGCTFSRVPEGTWTLIVNQHPRPLTEVIDVEVRSGERVVVEVPPREGSTITGRVVLPGGIEPGGEQTVAGNVVWNDPYGNWADFADDPRPRVHVWARSLESVRELRHWALDPSGIELTGNRFTIENCTPGEQFAIHITVRDNVLRDNGSRAPTLAPVATHEATVVVTAGTEAETVDVAIEVEPVAPD